MTLDRAFALKPGNELFWGKRPPKELEEEEKYFERYGRKRFSMGAYAEELFAESYGNPVKFIDFKYSFKNHKEINLDNSGFPIIEVETKIGNQSFSSSWFE